MIILYSLIHLVIVYHSFRAYHFTELISVNVPAITSIAKIVCVPAMAAVLSSLAPSVDTSGISVGDNITVIDVAVAIVKVGYV